MDKYGFMLELNNCLGFRFIEGGNISGEIKGLQYEIFFINGNSLFVRTRVRLFGDVPFRDHIEKTFKELKSFESFTLAEDIITLHADASQLSEDDAFTMSEDITIFSEKLLEAGYKDSTPAKPIDERFEEAKRSYQNETANPVIVYDENPEAAIPGRVGFGITGALIGAAVAMLLWIVLSLFNYMMPYVLGAVLVVAVPLIVYELFSGVRTSAFQIGTCLFISGFALFMGERLIWTFTLLRWYSDISFVRAYREVPYMIQDEIVSANDYYIDYIIIFAALVLFYIVIFRNYITGGMTVSDMLKKRNR